MKRVFLVLTMLAVAICLFSACSNMKTSIDDDGRIEIKGEQLENITKSSSPVGISEVEIVAEENSRGDKDYYLKGVIHKNSKKPETSDIILNYIVYDENQKRLDEVVVIEEDIAFEETVEFKEYIPLVSGGKPPVRYELILVRDADHGTEVEKDEIERAAYEMDVALANEEYNLAETILNEIKEKYPNNKDVKKIEAAYKDEMAKRN